MARVDVARSINSITAKKASEGATPSAVVVLQNRFDYRECQMELAISGDMRRWWLTADLAGARDQGPQIPSKERQGI